MPIRLAAALYPITAFTQLADWQQHTAGWVADAVRQNAGLLVFPEYGSMELASLLPGQARSDLRQQVSGLERLKADFLNTYAALARRHSVLIVAPSFPVREGDRVYNRVFVFSPQGLAGFQDKFFMTRFEDEEWGVQAGPPVLQLFECDWGSFGIQICYDVEFPIGSQRLAAAGAELILAPSCTETIRGATRVHVGARARALENQAYVTVSQTVGEALWSPAVDINYGYAAMYSPPDLGLPPEGILAQSQPQEPGWLVQDLDFELIKAVRKNGQVFNYKDQQSIDYQLNGQPVKVQRCRISA